MPAKVTGLKARQANRKLYFGCGVWKTYRKKKTLPACGSNFEKINKYLTQILRIIVKEY